MRNRKLPIALLGAHTSDEDGGRTRDRAGGGKRTRKKIRALAREKDRRAGARGGPTKG